MNIRRSLVGVAVATLVICLFSQALFAQIYVSQIPYARTGDVLLCDSSSDKIWRLVDLDMNGDFHGPGEIVSYYDGAVGPFALAVPNNVAYGPEGEVYVCDSSLDYILRLQDYNCDGDAEDPGESTIFFDATAQPSPGEPAASPNSMFSVVVDKPDLATGFSHVWVADSNADAVFQLTDLNFDGDANDVGESVVYVDRSGGGLGDSIITDVKIAPDGMIYFTENGTLAGVKGVYQCNDANNNGHCRDPGEVAVFWQPDYSSAPGSGNFYFWGFAVDDAGYFYLADSGRDLIWQGRDNNSDGTIDTTSETKLWLQPDINAGSSTMYKVAVGSDGSVWAAEDYTPDGAWRFEDVDGSGQIDHNVPGEVTRVYDETQGTEPAIGGKGICHMKAPYIDFPATPSASAAHTFKLEGALGESYYLWVSTGILAGGGVPVPPLGNLELNVFPPHIYSPLLAGVIPSGGQIAIPVPAGIFPSGTTFTLQAIVGSCVRLQFTNGQHILFTP